jgi:hypothetical protein
MPPPSATRRGGRDVSDRQLTMATISLVAFALVFIVFVFLFLGPTDSECGLCDDAASSVSNAPGGP